MRMMIDQTARAVRAIERGQTGVRIGYTERASRHHRTSYIGWMLDVVSCIAMVFGS